MITKLIATAAALPVPVSTIVRLHLERNHSSTDQQQATTRAVNKMDNDQKQQFALELIRTIMDANGFGLNEKAAAEEELTTLFGRDYLADPSVCESRDGFFYSLTARGEQFRVWYAPFCTVEFHHLDSQGSGCLLSANCDSAETLKEWLKPFIKGMVEWQSDGSRLWIGRHRGGW